MKITREGRNAIGALWSGLGGDPGLGEGEEPIDCCDPSDEDLPDRASDKTAVTVNTPGVGGIVQVKAGAHTANGAFDLTENFATGPTNGNTLYAVLFATDGQLIDSSGWSQIEEGTANGDSVSLWTKVAGASEPTAVHVDHNGVVGTRRLVLYEIAGTHDVSDATTNDSAASPLTGPSTVPSDDPSLLLAAFIGQVATYAPDPTWTPQGGLLLDSFARQPGPGRMVSGAYHVATAGAGPFVPSVATTPLYAGRLTANVAWTVDVGAATLPAWNVSAPNTVDDDDATYHEIDGPDVLRVDLDGAYVIVSSRLVVGSDDAGARQYTIRGANLADFSDADTLATESFDSTGGFTADELVIVWSTTTAYRYFELTGSDETRRVYSWELYEADISAGQDHNHDAIEAEIGGVSEALDEHAADPDAHGGTRGIEFIIDGGGAAITAGIKGDLEVPFACTITAWRIFGDQTGSITVGIWRDTYANFPPVVGDLLVSPALSSAVKAESTGLSHALAAGDILRFNADATPATVTRVTVSLTVTL